MRRPRFALAFPLALLLLVLPQSASAKDGLDVFRVVTPAGKVGVVRGQAAVAWWHDYETPGKRACAACATVDATSRYERKLARRFSNASDAWPVGHKAWLLSAVAHWGTMLYYPPTPGIPGVVLSPAARGPRGWPVHWEIASSRMESILRLALRKGTVTTYRNSSTFPTGWAVGGGLAGVALAAAILAAWRRTPFRGRRSAAVI